MSEQVAAVDAEVASAFGTDPGLLAALDKPEFSDLVGGALIGYGMRYGALVLVGDDALWFCSRIGFAEAQTPRKGSLWDAAMAAEGVFVVDDLLEDPRFAGDQNLVGGVAVRLFVSSVFRSAEGRPIGVLCFADPDPMEFNATNRKNTTGMTSYFEGELAAIAELDRAAEVQRALLPKRVPPLEGYEVAGSCLPAKYVGGDFFDWYAIEGGMAFTLADVMGKGVGAGIIAATVRATVRSARDEDAAVAVERAATAFLEDLRGADSFATLFHARLNAITGSISFVDAGHGLTVLVDPDCTAHRLSSNDVPLGMGLDDGAPRQEQLVVLKEGGTLVSFSDGVLDLYDGSLASIDRVVEIVQRASSAQDIVDEIERIARRDGAPDDVTVVVIKRMATAI